MEKEVASRAVEIAVRQYRDLDDLVRLFRDRLEPDEFKRYRHAIAEILGNMLVEVIWPILDEHPDLSPHEDWLPPGRTTS